MILDTQLFYLLNSLAGRSPFLDGVIVFLASYLAYILIVVFIALIFFSAYSKREKWEILVVAGVSSVVARFGITELIRFFYHHARPFVALPDVHALLTDSSWSFPSGHATFFFALSTAVYLYNKRWGSGFLIVSTLIVVGRVIAGVHYPSDIVAGAIIGSVIAWLIYGVYRRWIPQESH